MDILTAEQVALDSKPLAQLRAWGVSHLTFGSEVPTIRDQHRSSI
jgi:hypothetical protein